jgi:hypothetical protein
MSIPLDRLYQFVESVAQDILQDRVIIYRFYPYGSKNVEDMTPLHHDDWLIKQTSPSLYCNDQEPLDYDYYNTVRRKILHPWKRPEPNFLFAPTIYEKVLLLHSEKQSSNVEQYQQDQFIPVYWWTHAVIALDWFRYARHVKLKKQYKKTFLVYNRAWSGTREYRLRLAELLVQHNLQDYCQTSFNPIEPELRIHYNQHKFKNPAWLPQTVPEDYFPTNEAPSHCSADFDINDYNGTDIEVVLETLFDDDRIQLTEKSLRPIAMAQPFILAATAGSLKYLRSYGFKTFGSIWDESYDAEKDPEQRLYAIINLMAQINNWEPPVRERKLEEVQVIADYNRQHFFSQEFFNLVTGELTANLTTALVDIEYTKNYQGWIDRWEQDLRDPDIFEHIANASELSGATFTDINNIRSMINRKLNSE